MDFHPIFWIRRNLAAFILKDYLPVFNAQLTIAFKRYDGILSDVSKEQSALQIELREWLRTTLQPDKAAEIRHKELIDALNRIAR